MLRPLLEKVTARIAVSPVARRVQVEHLGGDAVEIPNGVDVPLFAEGPRLPGYPVAGSQVVGFVGRYDEPRKGMRVLLDAVRLLAAQRAGLRLMVVAGASRPGCVTRRVLARAIEWTCSARVDDRTKAAALRSMDVYCAPNLGRESFGMVLTEAMAAGAPVLASDLDAFRMVLGPAGGVLVPRGDPAALAAALADLLDDPDRREELAVVGRHRAARYDWPVVAGEVVRVYQAALAADPRRLAVGGPPPPIGPRRTASKHGAEGAPVSTTAVLLVVVLAVLLVGLVAWCVFRANRLDRLHVRTDAARAALLAALERRAVVARAIATHTGDDDLRRAAAAAEAAPLPARETAENRLGRLIAGLNREPLPPGVSPTSSRTRSTA